MPGRAVPAGRPGLQPRQADVVHLQAAQLRELYLGYTAASDSGLLHLSTLTQVRGGAVTAPPSPS